MRKLLSLILLLVPSLLLAQSSGGPTFQWGGNITVANASCVLGSCVRIDLPKTAASLSVTITGTWSATLQLENSADNGTTWISSSSTTGNGITTLAVSSLTNFRVRASALVSGNAGVYFNASTATLSSSSAPSQVSSLPAIPCTVATAAPVQLVISGVNYGTYYCGGNAWIPQGNATANALNVKAFGAFGDTHSVGSGFTWPTSSQTITCAACNFTSADVGKTIYSGSSTNGTGQYGVIQTVAAGVVTALTGFTTVSNLSGQSELVWGHIDDAAGPPITAIIQAIWNTQTTVGQSNGNTTSYNNVPTIYLPGNTGGYMFCGTNALPGFFNPTGSVNGAVTWRGDSNIPGSFGSTVIYPCPNPPNAFSGVSVLTSIGALSGSASIAYYDLAWEGAYVFFNANYGAVFAGSWMQNLTCQHNGTVSSGGLYCFNFSSHASGFNLTASANGTQGMVFGGDDDECHFCKTSNNSKSGVVVQNAIGAPNGSGIRFIGGQMDETSCSGGTANLQIVNSVSIWFSDLGIFTCISGFSVDVDGTSQLILTNAEIGPFSGGSGLKIQAGGKVTATNTRFYTFTSATNTCINNLGTFINLGGNTCELYLAATGTSAGTTATLTTAFNHRMTAANIGDFFNVNGMNVGGYNCSNLLRCYQITGVPAANQVTYTTLGSNIGAGTGGTAVFNTWNGGAFSGNPPFTDLTPTPNTFYSTLAVWGAATMGSQPNDRPTFISQVRATSNVSTTCATPPVLTVTNGNITWTGTLTSGQSVWDTKAGTFPTASGTLPLYIAPTLPSGTNSLTVSVSAGTCATPPTNFAVTTYQTSPGQP